MSLTVNEFAARKIRFARLGPIQITLKGQDLDCGFRADLLFEDKVLAEVKAVAGLVDIHKPQALTYLTLTQSLLPIFADGDNLAIALTSSPIKNLSVLRELSGLKA